MDATSLVRVLEDFLAEAPHAAVVDDGERIFDLATARYSVTDDHGRCLLHLWSGERNMVRRVLDAETRNGALRLTVQRFGRTKPERLDIVAGAETCTSGERRSRRQSYQRRLARALPGFADFALHKAEGFTSSMDLEHSLSPVYARGLLRKGQSAWAVLGVNGAEPQASVDGALTFGLLWLEHCRERHGGRHAVEGLLLAVPPGRAAVVCARAAHLDRRRARVRIFEFEELEDADSRLVELDPSDHGNIATRLVHCPDEAAARERFAEPAARIRALVPEAAVTVLSSSELAFRLHGLEFARTRSALVSGGFRRTGEIVFGAAGRETALTAETEPLFLAWVERLRAARRPGMASDHGDPLWRLAPERWLESQVLADIRSIESHLDPECVYSQVPAFSASDRAMIDVLAATRDGRLAVLELKASEDIHLALQGLDYWARVRWHQERGEFQRFGYFPGRALSQDPPRLLLVAPALRIHPATETLLRLLAPEVEWTLAAVDERWREELRVVYRKTRAGVRG